MAKLVVSLDGVVIKDVQITKDKTTLGRRPYNDIVIDNLAVSGEHAALQMVGAEVFNGKAIKRQLLSHKDTVEIGKYKIKYLVEDSSDYERTMIVRPGAGGHSPYHHTAPQANPALPLGGMGGMARMGSGVPAASIKVLSGAAAGRAVVLTKVVTTVGKPGVQVAAITRRPTGYVLAHVEGAQRPSINGVLLSTETAPLNNGDLIELAGTQMQFIHG